MNLTESLTNDTHFESTPNGSSCHSGDLEIVALLAIHRPMVATIDRYVTPIWYAIGFPGNLLAFLVWIQNTWHINTLYRPIWCQLFPILYLSAQHLSPLLVLGFTVERYISICHPFQRERYCSTRRARRVVASLLCFVLLLNAVQGYFWEYVDSRCSVREEAVRNDTRSLWSVWSWVTELLIFGVVPIVILILNILVIREAKRMADRDRRTMITTTKTMITTTTTRWSKSGGGGGGQSATTLTLLAVSFHLIFTTLPATAIYTLYYVFPTGDSCLPAEELQLDATWQRHFDYWNARVLIEEIGMSHYASNIFIYLLTGLAFRRELKTLLLRVVCSRSIKRWLTQTMATNASEMMTELTTYNQTTTTTTNGRTNRPDDDDDDDTSTYYEKTMV